MNPDKGFTLHLHVLASITCRGVNKGAAGFAWVLVSGLRGRFFMQVISIVQTKGGSGKTTAAMLLASAALDAGRRVTLIDGDVNAQLGRWRDSFDLAAWETVKKPAWPADLSIKSPPETVDGLLALLEEEEARGVDLPVIDTRPGTRGSNGTIVRVALLYR